MLGSETGFHVGCNVNVVVTIQFYTSLTTPFVHYLSISRVCAQSQLSQALGCSDCKADVFQRIIYRYLSGVSPGICGSI